ncbi:eCIS core domain-containing protein [Streptomyces sp. SudanB182_2057]|uniref:eCIS core domain-containing protein n=1 Tax=Streptomyces sp. SudanB182_2057 TaxID=3035281 RepID=UPI003F54373D
MTARAQDAAARETAEQRRRRRRERAAKSRTPEPKNIVSGAGQPLDPGLRRELEEQLGHDLSRVRLHTDRDADRLTELLGADAVAVGQDILFRAGAFRPGTGDGRRLLAHELLHSVQNPHGLGALRAGRDPGAVSLPQQSIEREAESAAQDLVRPSTEQTAPQVTESRPTPGWLRYATVHADRSRAEAVDPATLLDRLANSVVRSLRGDPEDLSRRTRKQLARLPEELLDGVLVRLENRLLAPEHDRVLDLVEETGAYDDHAQDLEVNAHDAPAIEPDVAEQLRTEREEALRSREQRRADAERPGIAPGPEKERADDQGAAGSTPQNGGTPEHGTTPQGGEAPHGRRRTPGSPGPARGPAPAVGTAGTAASTGGQEQDTLRAAPGAAPAGERRSDTETTPTAGREQSGKAGPDGGEQTGETRTSAASKEESAARNRPGAAEAAVAGQQLRQQDKSGQKKPTGSPTASGPDVRLPGPFSTLEGRRSQDIDGPEERTEEDPFGSGSESEVDVGGGEPSAWDVRLRPEDFLPERDLDVSAVPTADALVPGASASASVPSFPAPPPTRAEQVQAERDAEDAEEAEDGPEEETAATGPGDEPGTSAPETEGGPDRAGSSGPAVAQATAVPPAPGTRDPKGGDDPKAGPVAAQTTVQQAPGRADGASEGGGAAGETAAKEEQGTAAAGDKGAGGQEKESPKATGGQSAQKDAEAREAGAEAGSTGTAGRPTAVAQGAGSPASVPDASAAVPGPTAPGTVSELPVTQAPGAGEAPAPEARTTPGPRAAAAPQPAPTAKAAPAPARTATESPAEPEPAPRPAPEPESADGRASRGGSGGGGGGGGAGAAPARSKGKKDGAPVPDLSGVSPEAGLATAAKLKPHKALQAMGGVGGAVDRSVGDEHQALASAPPTMQRPAGAPQTLRGKPTTDAPAEYSQDRPQEAQAPEQKDAEVTGAKQPEGQIEAEKAEEPGGWDTFKMALGFIGGKIVNGVANLLGADKPVVDPQALAAKFAGLPTKDEALKQARAGDAPGVGMTGAAERSAGEQDGHVDAKGRQTIDTAREDSGRRMGEDQVYPDAPQETMTAKVPGARGGQGAAADGGGTTGAVPPEAASEVAEHERGPQFQAAFTDGTRSMSEGRQAKDRDVRDARDRHRQKVDAEIAANTESQAAERAKAMGEVTAQRADWRKEQDEQLQSLGDKKSERHDKVRKDVADKEKKTDDDVDNEKQNSDKKIQDESDKAEREADQKRDGAVQESGNWVSKAFDWIKQKVIDIKNAIVRVIRAARDAVVGFIRNFKDTVERWINEARKSIVDAIKNLIKDLIEFAVAMVRAVIELAARIRKFVTDLISAAIALVNRLAQALKQAVSDLLDAIGKLLSGLLDILRKALQAAVKAVVEAVKAVLEFASKLLSALGAWMMIAVDFLSDPGGWLGGAKNSAVDGAKNHLFREVSAAVKAWFQEKIQEIIGVPKAIIDKLVKGGFTLDRIVKEAWDAVVPQLPLIIGELVITKVVAKLIPGAGWVMAVIDAIRTAWGALSAILSSLDAVLTWLKAVRTGGAGILFAKAVAAGVVALLEVLYQALLSGIGKYVAKVGRRLRGVAANLTNDKSGKPGDRGRPGAEDTEGRAPKKPKTEEPTGRKPAPPARTPGDAKTPQTTNGQPGQPASKDRNGPPKNPTEKPDTRPTPPAKPKPRPEPRPRPKNEPEPRPKSPDGKASAEPRPGDGDTLGPRRPTADPGSGRSKPADNERRDRSEGEGKGDDRPGRWRTEGKGGDKPAEAKRRDKGGKESKAKHESKGPRHKRDTHEGRRFTEKGPDKEKQDRKDQRKKDEESQDTKDARLQKILARIRPRIKGTLKRGTTGVPFRMLLSGMRAWYRLTSLEAAKSGNHRDVLATLNPAGSAGSAYVPTPQEIRLIIREAVTGVLQITAVHNAAQRIADEEAFLAVDSRATRDIPVEELPNISHGADFPGAVTHMLARGANIPRSMMAYTIGREDENEQGRRRNVRQRIYDWHATPHPTNSEVKGVTSYPALFRTLRRVWQTVSRRARKKLDRSAGLAPEAVKALESLDRKDATVAQMIQGFLETGLWPQDVTKKEREKLGRVVYLMYVRESVRDPENVALAPVTIDLIARGHMTFHEAFAEFEGEDGTVESRTRTGGRGRYPASMEGAAPAARGLVAEDRNERLRVADHGREEARRELEWRKVDLVTRWLEVQLRSRGEVWGGTQADVVEFIRKFIVEHHGLVE